MDQPLERSAFAGFSSRVAAGLIDWLIVFAALWIAVIVQAVAGFDSPVSVVLSFATGLLPLLYFGLPWTRSGQTVGMGSNNIQMVDTRTWEPPSWIRAFLRALVAVLTFVACWLPLVVAFSDAPESNSRAAAIAAVAIAFAALALIGHLWALRVIDVQRDVVEKVHDREGVIANISTLVDKARSAGVAVIWVQHSDDNIEAGTPGWEYVPELQRDESEPLVHKNYGDAFEATDLEDLLAEGKVGHLVVSGTQTDGCIRSTLHGPSSGATTPRWSGTPIPPRTPASGAYRSTPSRSSPTPMPTGPGRPFRVAKEGPSQRSRSNSPPGPDAPRGTESSDPLPV